MSCPQLEEMPESAGAAPGSLGARMAGGGFSGSAVRLVRRDDVDATPVASTRACAKAPREPVIHVLDAGDRAARVP